MLAGGGYFKGSSTLLTGGPGTGKTTIAAHFAEATCRRGERCIYFSFEESPSPTCAQHAFGRDRSAAVDRQGAVAMPRLAAKPRRAGDASGAHVEGDQGFRSRGGDRRPVFRAAGEWRRQSDRVHGASSGRLPQNAGASRHCSSTLQDSDDPSELHISSIMDTWLVVRNMRSDTELSRRLTSSKRAAWRIRTRCAVWRLPAAACGLTDLPPASHGPRRNA